MAAVDRVYGGAEIIDSRYRDFRFTLPDVVADNASSARVRRSGPVGRAARRAWTSRMEAVLVEVDGAIVDSATGAAVQGHPAEALALAANDLGRRGLRDRGRLDRPHRRHDRRRVRAPGRQGRLPTSRTSAPSSSSGG